MKIRIELEQALVEDEIIIKCCQLTPTIQKIQQAITNLTSDVPKISFIKENVEYYLPLDEILFFETSEQGINAHSKNEVYQVKYKLYELEEILPHSFLRVSKSAILNTEQILSINRTLASSNLVQFYNSHKQVYVSRYYYKHLRKRLEERR